MHTYRKTNRDEAVWTVGYYTLDNPDPEVVGTMSRWMPLKDFDNEKEAAAYVSYLNGGDHPNKPFPAETI